MKNNTYPMKTDFLGMGLVVDYEKLLVLQASYEKNMKEIDKTAKTDTKGREYVKKFNRKMLKR